VLRVLICDDDPSIRFVLKRILTRECEVEVDEAPDGLEAVKALVSSKFDLLILDLQMPGVDGHETLKTIRESAFRDLPVLIVSGERSSEAVSRVIKLGIAGFIVKPFDRDTLVPTLRTYVARIAEEEHHAKARDARR
jgi:DNA-binding response OmpR family regulator